MQFKKIFVLLLVICSSSMISAMDQHPTEELLAGSSVTNNGTEALLAEEPVADERLGIEVKDDAARKIDFEIGKNKDGWNFKAMIDFENHPYQTTAVCVAIVVGGCILGVAGVSAIKGRSPNASSGHG